MDVMQQFQQFFDCCVGNWQTERTYHYLTHQEVERSHTEFVINPLTSDLKLQVLSDNHYEAHPTVDSLPGYHLAFQTLSEKGEAVAQELNMLFVPHPGSLLENGSILEGNYLRDCAYEEAKPIVASFRFYAESRELLMTTYYTQVVSVDSITLINPQLRIRKILNYRRPEEEQPLSELVLVGFGVEQKSA